MIGEFFYISAKIGKRLAKFFNNSHDKILDLGCGENPWYHKSMKGNITCFDKSKSGITHIVGDADFLPFKPNSFDKIVSINSFYYFKNPFNVAKDLRRILRKNGKLVIVTPFFYPIHDIPFDNYRFTEHGIKHILEECFIIENIEPMGGIFSFPSVILHSFIKGAPLLARGFLRDLIKVVVYLIFYVPYIISQFLEILNVFDKTRRVPVYYMVIASRRQ